MDKFEVTESIEPTAPNEDIEMIGNALYDIFVKYFTKEE